MNRTSETERHLLCGNKLISQWRWVPRDASDVNHVLVMSTDPSQSISGNCSNRRHRLMVTAASVCRVPRDRTDFRWCCPIRLPVNGCQSRSRRSTQGARNMTGSVSNDRLVSRWRQSDHIGCQGDHDDVIVTPPNRCRRWCIEITTLWTWRRDRRDVDRLIKTSTTSWTHDPDSIRSSYRSDAHRRRSIALYVGIMQ